MIGMRLAFLLLALLAVSRADFETCTCSLAEFPTCSFATSTPGICTSQPCSGYVCDSLGDQTCDILPGQSFLRAVSGVDTSGEYACEVAEASLLAVQWRVVSTIEDYSWEGLTGPANWDVAFPDCGGSSQSPVDILTTRNVEFMETGMISDVLDQPTSADFEITQSKSNPVFNCVSPDGCGTLTTPDGTVYSMIQFHGHSPSEHHVDGNRFSIEFHYVHATEDGQLAVVGVFQQITAETPTSPLDALSPEELAADGGVTVTLNPQALIPQGSGYETYSGSLTTPPCSEGVAWHVVNTPQTISQDFYLSYFEQIGGYPGNGRPPQPLNGRTITQFTPA